MFISIDLCYSPAWSENCLNAVVLINTETDNCSIYWECSALDGTTIPPPPPSLHLQKAQGTFQEEEEERTLRARGWGGILWNTIIWWGHDICRYELTAAVITVYKSCITLSQLKFPHGDQRGPLCSTPVEKLLAIVGCWGKELYFFKNVSTGRFSMSQWMSLCSCAYTQHINWTQ